MGEDLYLFSVYLLGEFLSCLVGPFPSPGGRAPSSGGKTELGFFPFPWGNGEKGTITGILKNGYWPEGVNCGISGITITEERKQHVFFSDSYFTSGQSVLVPQGSSFRTVKQLEGAVVSFQQGSSSELILSQIPPVSPLAFETWPEALQALLEGRSQAAIVDSPLALEVMRNRPEFTLMDALLTREHYGVFFPKNTDARLIEKINKVIQNEAPRIRAIWMP